MSAGMDDNAAKSRDFASACKHDAELLRSWVKGKCFSQICLKTNVLDMVHGKVSRNDYLQTMRQLFCPVDNVSRGAWTLLDAHVWISSRP